MRASWDQFRLMNETARLHLNYKPALSASYDVSNVLPS